MKHLPPVRRFAYLFNVQVTEPSSSRWLWCWGAWGVLCGTLAVIEQIPDIVQHVVAPISSIAFDLRAVQVVLIGLWIAWKQPWSPADPLEQRKGWMLNIICAGLLGPAIGVLLLDSDPWGSVWYYLTLGTLLLQIFWLSRRGLVRLAAILLTTSLVIHWLGLGGLNTDLREVGYVFAYSLIFLVGGVLVRWWFGLSMALLLPLLSTLLAALGISATAPNWSAAFLYVLLLSAYASIIALYTWTLESALISTDANNLELKQARDILSQANEQLRNNAAQLKTIISNNPVILFVLDQNGIFKMSEGAGLERLGLKPGQVVGQSAFDLYKDHPDILRLLKQTLAGQASHAILDVSSATFDVYYSPIHDEQGIVSGAVCVATDITEQKHTEDKLRESEQRYRQLVELSPDAIAVHSEGKIVFVNPAAVKIMGAVRAEELLGKPALEIVHPDFRDAALARIRQSLTQGRAAMPAEERFLRMDGSSVEVEVLATPIVYQGRPAMQVIARDITERKQAEEALRESRTMLQQILDTVPQSIFWKDKDSVYLGCNRVFAAAAGSSPENIIGKTDFDLPWPRQEAEAYRRADAYVIAHQAPMRNILEPLQQADGVRLWIDTTKLPLVDGHGDVYGVLGVYEDVTERQRAEQALRESEARYRQLFNGLNDAVMVYDLETSRFADCNEGVSHLLGYTRDEFLALQPADIVHPDFHETLRTNQQRLKSGENTIIESRHYRKNGSTVPVEINSRQMTYQGARMLLSVVRDITERKRAEDALRESEERYRRLIETSPDAITLTDMQGTILFCNQQAALLQGLGSVAEMIGRNAFEFVAPENAQRALANMRKTLEMGSVKNVEYVSVKVDGTRFMVDLSASVILDAEGNPSTLLGVVRDITERKKAEETLRQNEAIFSSFLEHSPVYVFFKDKNIRTLRLSRNYEQMLGISIQEAIGKSMDELFPSPLAKSMVADDLRILREGKRVDITEALNGRVYETTKFPIFIDGQPEMLAGFTVDVTERKRIESALQESQRRLSTALRATKLGVWEWDLRTSQAYWSDENYRLMGWAPGEVESRYENWAQAVHPDDLPEAEAKVAEAVHDRRELNIEFRVVWPDGSIHWINDIGSVLVDEAGQTLGMYGIQMDITERKHMEELLFAEKERAEITLHSIGDAVITVNVDELVEYLNPVAENLTGWRLEEAIGQPLDRVFRIIEEVSRQPASSPVRRCLQEDRVVGLTNHSVLLSRTGSEFSIDDSAAPIRNPHGDMIGVVLVFHDVTEERRLTRKVAHDAMHDSLTGLVNRREFEKRLERALVTTREQNLSHILCYLDLDQFKVVNDTAGHAAGDELLRQLAGLLGGLFRQRDTFARLGGDEFGLLLENCHLEQALIIANEIKAKIRNYPFVWAGHGFHVGVSIGVVPITSQIESVNQLMSQADVACYSAKDLGRDRVYVYQLGDSEATQRHSEIIQAARMRDAIFQERFRLFCQPIIQVRGEPTGISQYEILLRMADHEGGLIFPGAFIPSAERYGEMQAIDRWVIREAFLTMAKHDTESMLININLSGSSLDDETLLEYVLEQLGEFLIPPGRVCFEITETAAIRHLNKAQRFISTFRAQGGKIALDDFGSGFSSFRYLQTLSVDYLKIDGGFVSDMLSNAGDLLMVEAITRIAHTLGIQVIAEHASNRDTLDRLQEMGVDCAQGYGIGLPVPVTEAWKRKA